MKSLLSLMKMTELKLKRGMSIKCPICNQIVSVEVGKRREGIHFIPEYKIKCEHISAEVEIFDYELEDAPLDYYEDGWNEDSDSDRIYHTKYVFSAEGYLPKLKRASLETPKDLKKFLEERRPDHFIKIKENEIDLTRYFFFKSEGFGMFD